MKIILASQSPRRKEILNYFSLPFSQLTHPFDEESIHFTGDPKQYVLNISQGKAGPIAHQFPEAIVIAADTTVVLNGKVYGKPKDEEEACLFLSELVGKWHSVFTGVTVQQGSRAYHQAEETRVLFNNLNTEQIRHYITHTEWHERAGGYSIQMAGGLCVSKIEGCYYNVMGLPINTLERLLKHFGIELWNHLGGK